MSLNKVLNRPMFRQKALKKGHLKPIHAQIGTMVGLPTGAPSVYNPRRLPMVVPQPGFFKSMSPYVGRAGRGIGRMLSLPAYLGYEATGQVANAMGMQDSAAKIPLQIAGA